MSKRDDILEELRALPKQGMDILHNKEFQEKRTLLMIDYEAWYSRALAAVRQIAPARLDDFVACYKQEKRREIDSHTYTISDFLRGITVTRAGQEVFSSYQAYFGKLLQQISIVSAAAKSADSVLADIQTVLQAELLDNDLAAARELKKAKHLRSAGVVCGVILESHLKAVAARHSVTIGKKSPSVSDLNDLLKNAGVYDVPMWRLLQRLGDIRNLCCHSRERDPRDDEVEDLLVGTDKVVREIT
jgi:hypothetical protein